MGFKGFKEFKKFKGFKEFKQFKEFSELTLPVLSQSLLQRHASRSDHVAVGEDAHLIGAADKSLVNVPV